MDQEELGIANQESGRRERPWRAISRAWVYTQICIRLNGRTNHGMYSMGCINSRTPPQDDAGLVMLMQLDRVIALRQWVRWGIMDMDMGSRGRYRR